jgi:hypothetical protein
MSEEKTHYEEFRVEGDKLVAKMKELFHEGNIRRVIIKNDKGNTVMEIPLTIGVVGAILLPVLVAVGAIAALAANYTLLVERTGEKPAEPPKE